MKQLIKILTLAGSMLAMDFAAAQTAYIRDTLYVPLRSGQGTSFRIVHKGLKTGSKLNVLEVSEDEKYTKVVTSRGIEGWIQSQYLSYEPVASIKLAAAEAQLAKLAAENKELNTRRSELSGSKSELQKSVVILENENAELSSELKRITEISANAIKLNEDNRKLTESTQLLKNKIDLLEADNLRLQNDRTKSMWLTGASIAFVFTCLGWIIATRKRKDSGWGNSGL
ncbi:TIGR04211 family SH3 domain-containing protein [Litoribrevibacter euphylliae]|uniref:TIGR04211 family SH3 domain-containing protein n=1 Tax=Litoribrevibacter euphylliae TaxID=1834034 RepID=A0ABV7HMN8_9GAMM